MSLGPGSIKDDEEIVIRKGGQVWQISWHLPEVPPNGTSHGSAGVCFSDHQHIALVSRDGANWGYLGGRPEGTEIWEETLRREILEEACASVTESRLLGFSRSRCIAGSQKGLVLVRSFWQTRVDLDPWLPHFEMGFRREFPISVARDVLLQSHPEGDAPVVLRVFDEAAWI